MKMERVKGKKKGDIKLYALSTCGWCRKTRDLLNELGVEYDYSYVDLASEEEKDNLMDEVRKWNPGCSFPTIVLDNKTCIVGFQPDELKSRLG